MFFRYGEVCIRKFGIHIFPFEHTPTTRSYTYRILQTAVYPFITITAWSSGFVFVAVKPNTWKLEYAPPWVHISIPLPDYKMEFVYTHITSFLFFFSKSWNCMLLLYFLYIFFYLNILYIFFDIMWKFEFFSVWFMTTHNII